MDCLVSLVRVWGFFCGRVCERFAGAFLRFFVSFFAEDCFGFCDFWQVPFEALCSVFEEFDLSVLVRVLVAGLESGSVRGCVVAVTVADFCGNGVFGVFVLGELELCSPLTPATDLGVLAAWLLPRRLGVVTVVEVGSVRFEISPPVEMVPVSIIKDHFTSALYVTKEGPSLPTVCANVISASVINNFFPHTLVPVRILLVSGVLC